MFKAAYFTNTHGVFFRGTEGALAVLNLALLGQDETIDVLGRLIESHDNEVANGVDPNEGAQFLMVKRLADLPGCFVPIVNSRAKYRIHIAEPA